MKKNILALILISIAMTLFANEDIKFYKDYLANKIFMVN